MSTGEQYEITSGSARAIITERGATLRLYEVGGQAYTQTFAADEEPPLGCGNVLVPWPNRTAGARWEYQGTPQQLEATEPARGNAIHGLVRKKPWQVINHGTDMITLGIDIPSQEGWPTPLRTEIRYRVTETELTVTHFVANAGINELTFGVGAHPYPKPGAAQDCAITLPAASRLPLDAESMLPSGPTYSVQGTAYDLRAGGKLGEIALDDAFTDLEFGSDGRSHTMLRGSNGGVELWADPDFRWLQVFTPPEFAGRPGAVAVEPMTCPPDALNSGTDLITLGRNEWWEASWGIRPLMDYGAGAKVTGERAS